MGGKEAHTRKYERENEGQCWRDASCSASLPPRRRSFVVIAGPHLNVAGGATHRRGKSAATVNGGREVFFFSKRCHCEATASHSQLSEPCSEVLKWGSTLTVLEFWKFLCDLLFLLVYAFYDGM